MLATLAPATLKKLHRGLAEALTASESVDHEAIAEHWIGGDVPDRGRAAAVAAADQAAHALAFDLVEGVRSLIITGWDGEALALGFGLAAAIATATIALSAGALRTRLIRT